MLNHMGTITLETERLILRKFKQEDAMDMYNNWASDSDVTKYLTWVTHENIGVSKDIIRIWINDYTNLECYQWAIELKENNSVIGGISLINIDKHNENCEIGYCIGKRYWNKGITTEAFNAIIKFALKKVGFERITGRHDTDNSASGHVMEKCGLKYEGTLRKISRTNCGNLVDCKYYSILKEEWEEVSIVSYDWREKR